MEREFIEELRACLPSHPQLRLGVGDDAAVLRLSQQRDCVVTSDLLADGTHFRLPSGDLRRVGRKALAVNLSDLAAMAARPVAAVVSLLLPRCGALTIARRLYEGLLPLAGRFNVAIAGGDTNCWNGRLVVSVTVIGETAVHGPLRRDGARPGDAILVTGELGGSRLGKHFDFSPRVAEALLLHRQFDLHAGMDISDGLSLDLYRMCQASGCGAVVDLESVPISPAAHSLFETSDGRPTPVDHALSDGEDFELLLAVPPHVAEQMIGEQPLDVHITQIGHFIDELGLWSQTPQQPKQPLSPTGFEHGR